MGTLMAEVQNENTSGNMWKKCSMPLKAHELLLADLNMRDVKELLIFKDVFEMGISKRCGGEAWNLSGTAAS